MTQDRTSPHVLERVEPERDSETHHVFCCDENLALCGLDITHHHRDEDAPVTCVVCADLEDQDGVCEVCGE